MMPNQSSQSGIPEQNMFVDQQGNVGMPIHHRMHPMLNMNPQNVFPPQHNPGYGMLPHSHSGDFRYPGPPPGNGAQPKQFYPPEFTGMQQPNSSMIGLLSRCSDELNQRKEQKAKKWRFEIVRYSSKCNFVSVH